MSKSRTIGKRGSNSSSEPATSVWGENVEHGDFLKVPRALLMLRKYVDKKKFDLQPRHFYLLLVIASQKYKDHPVRKYWEELAESTGYKRNTVRKWAYELERMGLLRMKRHRGRDPVKGRVGTRNERNEFFIDAFVNLVEQGFTEHQKQKKLRRKARKEPSNG